MKYGKWCRFCQRPRADFLVLDPEDEYCWFDSFFCKGVAACVRREMDLPRNNNMGA